MANSPRAMDLPVSSIESDTEGSGLLNSPDMEVYDRFILAGMKGQDISSAIRAISMLPPEQRYVSRIISALGFAFADFDSVCIRIDLDTMPSTEIDRMKEVLETRTIQFCILVREFFGPEALAAIMSAAAEQAAQMSPRSSDGPLI